MSFWKRLSKAMERWSWAGAPLPTAPKATRYTYPDETPGQALLRKYNTEVYEGRMTGNEPEIAAARALMLQEEAKATELALYTLQREQCRCGMAQHPFCPVHST